MSRKRPSLDRRQITRILTAAGYFVAGIVLVAVVWRTAGAANYAASVEAETGTPGGNAAAADDQLASGGSMVRFGSSGSGPAASRRDNPLAPSGGLGQYNLSKNNYVMGFRFVFDKQQTIDRWYFSINGEGASCVGGRTGYGNGNGGMHYGRIVEVDQTTGLPTSTVLASESVNGCTAHNRAKSEYGLNTDHQIHFVQFSNPVTIQPDKMYAFLLSNTDPNPGCSSSSGGSCGNHMSPNLNYASVSQLGPNGRNNVDRDAPGATYGLDPRETVLWSKDTGQSWIFGDGVGWYDTNDGNTMMWIVGYRPVGGQGTAHGWPWFNWPGESSGQTVTFKNSPKSVTLTHAGGSGSSVGTITVTNTSTGVSGKTSSLGSGMVRGQLDKPVPVAAGQSYTVRASGSVEMGASTGTKEAFGLGSRAPWIFSSSTSNRFPAVYASPHPYW